MKLYKIFTIMYYKDSGIIKSYDYKKTLKEILTIIEEAKRHEQENPTSYVKPTEFFLECLHIKNREKIDVDTALKFKKHF